jgi:glycosyltransferase involved in cell wall biosynthesis
MLKGYQHFAGRALVGLRALERCSDLLAGYEVAIYCSVHDVILAAELFSFSTGIPTRIIPHHSPHDEILRLHGQARISLGLSISDAISTSLLEAMVMGSFPIQSWTACADEWIEYGKNGMLVPPEDPDVIEKSLRLALTDDCLVDAAAAYNERLMQERLDSQKLKKMAVEFYRIVAKENGIAI